MKLAKNYDTWTEWQKAAYTLIRNKNILRRYEVVEEKRIGKNYVCLIDVPGLEDNGFLRLFVNGHNFLMGGTLESGRELFESFVEGIEQKTIKLPSSVPFYDDF